MDALFGRVGWQQPLIVGSPVISDENKDSASGRYFNDGSFHNLVTVANIKSTMEESAASDDNLNATLEQMQRSIIIRSLAGLFNPPEYIEQSLLYDRVYTNQDIPLENTGKFVGVKFKLPPAVDLATQVNSIGLYFDSAVTFKLYLYSDTKKVAVWNKEVTTVANEQTVITIPDLVLNYISDTNQGNTFYLGYFQSDLGEARAIREQNVRFSCNHPYAYAYFEANKTDELLFDKSQLSYTQFTYGLNLHVSVFRDHTWQIVRNPALFDNLVGLQMAAQVVEQIIFNTRSNDKERILKDQMTGVAAHLDMDGVAPISDGPKTTGLRKQIQQELNRLKDSFFPKPKATTVNIATCCN